MIKTCDELRVMLAGIFPRRFNPSTEIFQRAIENGRLGKSGTGGCGNQMVALAGILRQWSLAWNLGTGWWGCPDEPVHPYD